MIITEVHGILSDGKCMGLSQSNVSYLFIYYEIYNRYKKHYNIIWSSKLSATKYFP